jgi:hypothetical protein
MSKSIIYQMIKELGGTDVPVQDIATRIREKYPSDKWLANRVNLKLQRLHKFGYISRRMRKGQYKNSGYSYTIISDYP